MTARVLIREIERLTFDELVALNAWTLDARGDAEYLALASEWLRMRQHGRREG